MKILLTNHSLAGVGGTEKWTYAVAKELSEMGHEVSVYAMMLGITSDKMDFAEVVHEVWETDFDLILSNHNTCLSEVLGDTPIIHTSHGPKNGLEHPAAGADAYVGVSEEVRLAYPDYNMSVITNGIDLDEFKPQEMNRAVPRVLSMCKNTKASGMLQSACEMLGLEFDWVHYHKRLVWDTAPLIRDADIIIGCGRTALEGLACGKSVMVFDGRTDEPMADGWITEKNVEDLRRSNFSCRRREYKWEMPQLLQAFRAYEPSPWARQWAEENADVRKKVRDYLSIHARMSHGSI